MGHGLGPGGYFLALPPRRKRFNNAVVMHNNNPSIEAREMAPWGSMMGESMADQVVRRRNADLNKSKAAALGLPRHNPSCRELLNI